jgi:hypothetical protein
MFISTTRQKYVLDKCAESIKSAYSYSLNSSLYAKTFNLKYKLDNREYGVVLCLLEGNLKSVTLHRENGEVEIKIDGHESKFEELSKLMHDKIMEIDDIKFKRIFPEYNLMEERNDILDELLNSSTKEVEEVQEEIQEEVQEEVQEKPLKKKWFKIW